MKVQISTLMASLSIFMTGCSNGNNGGGNPAAPVAPAPVETAAPAPAPVPAVPDIQGDFSYNFNFNGCTTGEQKFSSKKAYCDGLLNDALNANCAREMRAEMYNRMCTVSQPADLNALAPQSAARCVVNGMDLKDRTFLQNLNPFNPQRRQVFRDLFWDGKKARNFGLMSSADAYGKARFAVAPASADKAALGEISILQPGDGDLISASSKLGTQVRLAITNFDSEKETEVTCRSDKSFLREKKSLEQVVCALKTGKKDSPFSEETLVWDRKSALVKELRAPSQLKLTVHLNPPADGVEERILIEGVTPSGSRAFKAESTLNEGIEVRSRSGDSRLNFAIVCLSASK